MVLMVIGYDSQVVDSSYCDGDRGGENEWW